MTRVKGWKGFDENLQCRVTIKANVAYRLVGGKFVEA